MSARIIVTVGRNQDDDLQVFLSKAHRHFDDMRDARVLGVDEESLPAMAPPDGVRQYGQRLYEALKGHQAIGEALADVAHLPEPTPIYFYCTAAEAERIVWESLCDDDGAFLALRRNWPIGRMADSEVDVGSDEIVWTPPLRVFALLSAIPFPAQPEWECLYDAVQAARADGLPIELRVMVGEEELLETIRALDDPLTTAEPVPHSTIQIETAIQEFEPQIVHFFCHGSAGFGRASLELASLQDWSQLDRPDPPANPSGNVVLTLEQLTDLQPIGNVWLVTLNCCEGGQAGDDVHSLAHSLVMGGVGAAVGMLEPVDATDAHEFCCLFYPSIFRHIQERLDGVDVGAAFELEWSGSLYPPRRALGDSGAVGAEADRRWCLPVLYATPERFRVRRAATTDRDVARRAGVHRDVYDGFINSIGDESPDLVAGARELLSEADSILFDDG